MFGFDGQKPPGKLQILRQNKKEKKLQRVTYKTSRRKKLFYLIL